VVARLERNIFSEILGDSPRFPEIPWDSPTFSEISGDSQGIRGKVSFDSIGHPNVRFRLCFVVISLLLTALGVAIGCIRTFRRLGLFATFSVFGIIAICIITMASTSHTYPYFGDGSPVKTEVVRRDVDFQTQLVAAMNMVNAYGGKYTRSLMA